MVSGDEYQARGRKYDRAVALDRGLSGTPARQIWPQPDVYVHVWRR